MKVQLNGCIVCIQYGFQKKEERQFLFYPWIPQETKDMAIVRNHSIEIEVPDDYDPTQAKINALMNQKVIAREALAKELMQLDQEIQKLQALPNEVK